MKISDIMGHRRQDKRPQRRGASAEKHDIAPQNNADHWQRLLVCGGRPLVGMERLDRDIFRSARGVRRNSEDCAGTHRG